MRKRRREGARERERNCGVLERKVNQNQEDPGHVSPVAMRVAQHSSSWSEIIPSVNRIKVLHDDRMHVNIEFVE